MKRIREGQAGDILRKYALEQLRETRKRMEREHGELFDVVRKMISESGGYAVQDMGNMTEEKIDRKKNLETVLKFAAIKPQADNLRRALEKIINGRN